MSKKEFEISLGDVWMKQRMGAVVREMGKFLSDKWIDQVDDVLNWAFQNNEVEAVNLWKGLRWLTHKSNVVRNSFETRVVGEDQMWRLEYEEQPVLICGCMDMGRWFVWDSGLSRTPVFYRWVDKCNLNLTDSFGGFLLQASNELFVVNVEPITGSEAEYGKYRFLLNLGTVG